MLPLMDGCERVYGMNCCKEGSDCEVDEDCCRRRRLEGAWCNEEAKWLLLAER